MERLIKDGSVILDGTLTRADKEKQAFKKLEDIEGLMESYDIEDLSMLHRILFLAWSLGEIKQWKAREENVFEMLKECKTAEERVNVLIKGK